MRGRPLRWLLPIAACLTLSCSYVFRVAVTPSADGPRISLGSVQASAFSRRPGCARWVRVTEVATSDVVWAIENKTCPTATSFIYGRLPRGWRESVPASALRPGVLYDVTISAGGGIGGTQFLADGSDLGQQL